MTNYVTNTSDKKKNTALIMCIIGGWYWIASFLCRPDRSGGVIHVYRWIVRVWMDKRYYQHPNWLISR